MQVRPVQVDCPRGDTFCPLVLQECLDVVRCNVCEVRVVTSLEPRLGLCEDVANALLGRRSQPLQILALVALEDFGHADWVRQACQTAIVAVLQLLETLFCELPGCRAMLGLATKPEA